MVYFHLHFWLSHQYVILEPTCRQCRRVLQSKPRATPSNHFYHKETNRIVVATNNQPIGWWSTMILNNSKKANLLTKAALP